MQVTIQDQGGLTVKLCFEDPTAIVELNFLSFAEVEEGGVTVDVFGGGKRIFVVGGARG
jgi:hypothetical protein